MSVFFNQSNRAQTSIVEIVAVIVAIFIIGWFFVRPRSAVLSEQRAQLRQAQLEYQRVEQDKNDLAQLVAKLNSSSTDIVLVDEALPLQDRPTQLEVLFDSLVSASGMQIVELTFQPAENSIAAGDKTTLANSYGVSRTTKTTTFDLSVSGSIDQFKNLLQLIETNGRVVDVGTLDMTNDKGNPVFKLKLKVYTYVP